MLESGQMLGENTILTSLGNGSFGFVFSSNHSAHPIPVALKVCKLPFSEEDKLRFIQENKILHNLKTHSNIIVPLSEVQESAPLIYYIMELADCNFGDYINHNYTVLDTKTRIDFFKKVCDGLEHAHGKQVVHRDLWWNNILLKEEGGEVILKINDFGRAKDFTLDDINTGDEPCLGHIYVRPPEIEFGIFDSVDISNYIPGDLYALGIVLYFIFSGLPSFYYVELGGSIQNFKMTKGITSMDSVLPEQRKAFYDQWLQERKAQPFASLRVSLSDADLNSKLNQVIGKLCHLNYKERYQSVTELKDNLVRLSIC